MCSKRLSKCHMMGCQDCQDEEGRIPGLTYKLGSLAKRRQLEKEQLRKHLVRVSIHACAFVQYIVYTHIPTYIYMPWSYPKKLQI